ncbi:hypothetical protein ACJMK2_023849, partial [Sinanodonta woodiana]
IREAKTQHRRNGAAATWSTYLTNFDDATLTHARASDILSRLDFTNTKYTLDVIYTSLKKTDGGATWKLFHHRKRVSVGGKLFVLTKDTTAGALVGIDGQYYNIAYPFNVIVYGCFPVLRPNESEVAGMKLSTTLNCVAEQVIKHFKNAK